MKKSELLEHLYETITSYEDYCRGGIAKEHPVFDFSPYDITMPEETGQDEKLVVQEQKLAPENLQSKEKMTSSGKTVAMIELAKTIKQCKACQLGTKSPQRVSGKGLVRTSVMAIVNPAGFVEVKEDRPYPKEVWDYFAKWMNSINLELDQVFVTNILKCNSTTMPMIKDYIEACRVHLNKQIDIVQPKVILAVGEFVLSSLKRASSNIMEEHGKTFEYHNIPVFPIFEPQRVQKDSHLRAVVWEDLKRFKALLELRLAQ